MWKGGSDDIRRGDRFGRFGGAGSTQGPEDRGHRAPDPGAAVLWERVAGVHTAHPLVWLSKGRFSGPGRWIRRLAELRHPVAEPAVWRGVGLDAPHPGRAPARGGGGAPAAGLGREPAAASRAARPASRADAARGLVRAGRHRGDLGFDAPPGDRLALPGDVHPRQPDRRPARAPVHRCALRLWPGLWSGLGGLPAPLAAPRRRSGRSVHRSW
jgi:hypothetical protein